MFFVLAPSSFRMFQGSVNGHAGYSGVTLFITREDDSDAHVVIPGRTRFLGIQITFALCSSSHFLLLSLSLYLSLVYLSIYLSTLYI